MIIKFCKKALEIGRFKFDILWKFGVFYRTIPFTMLSQRSKKVHGNQRGWPETDHGDLYGVYSLELEKEVTQWSYQELRRDKSVVGVKMSLPLKSWNIYHNILNKITNNCETSGCYVSCHTAKTCVINLKVV